MCRVTQLMGVLQRTSAEIHVGKSYVKLKDSRAAAAAAEMRVGLTCMPSKGSRQGAGALRSLPVIAHCNALRGARCTTSHETSCVKAPPIAPTASANEGEGSIPFYQLVRLPLLPSLHPGRLHSRAAMRRAAGTTGVLRWCSLIANRGYATAQQPQKTGGLRNVRHVIAVASGKGGVGKSTAAGARGGALWGPA